jgi:hypothetical protein
MKDNIPLCEHESKGKKKGERESKTFHDIANNEFYALAIFRWLFMLGILSFLWNFTLFNAWESP